MRFNIINYCLDIAEGILQRNTFLRRSFYQIIAKNYESLEGLGY